MTGGAPQRRRRALVGAVALAGLVLAAGCSGDSNAVKPKPTAPSPSSSNAECGDFTIAYDPSNGYEASPFIVGQLATDELGCDVTYVKTTSRKAWRLVADGTADVYLDAYGNDDLREKLAGEGGPVTVVGPNGIKGAVNLEAPAFMGELGLDTAQDLSNTSGIGWQLTTPSITTSPELLPLAKAIIDFQQVDYIVRNAAEIDGKRGMRYVLPRARNDDLHGQPNLYLVEAPRNLLGDGPGRIVVDVPESAAAGCEPTATSTLCSLANFKYEKIVNSEFAASDSPAYSLVYAYRLESEDVATVEELVDLSRFNVSAADMSSWLNTHKEAWKRWLE